MDEDFGFFLESMGPAIERRNVPQLSIERHRGKLPNQLLTYWQDHGWCGYADGLFWTVDPDEYEPVLDAWIGNTPFMERDGYHIIARSAFGELFFWGENTGSGLHILPFDSMIFPTRDDSKWMKQGRADDAVRWFFSGTNRNALDFVGSDQRPLFVSTLKKLGRLQHDEMYGFVPALALGGPSTLDHLQKVKAVEHLVMLAQLAPLRVMNAPAI